jgi:23S rRNA pseudouridine1911/1915/1917 synthase
VQAERPRHRPDVDVAVVHREAELVVVYKPSGVLSTPAPGRREASVISTVQRWFRAAFAVHRIDEGTSGLLAVALTERMQSALKALFERHDIERRYLALVRGRPRWNETMVRSTLIRDRGDGLRGSGSGRHAEADATAREAITHLRAIESRGDLSLIEAKLETGRTHQVRIHLADQRFPILGDTLYGGARFERLALHAAILGFAHPLTQEPLRFVSPLPDALHTRLCSPR